ncbi:MAG: ATP synthase F1 subunit epsilon [Bacillota bacterium]
MNTLELRIVTPREVILEARATSVIVPGSEGDFEVLWNHTPLVSALRPGRVVAVVDGVAKDIGVTGGFVEVTPGRVQVLAGKEGLTPP